MTGFPIYYNRMHVSVDNMNTLIEDIENLQIRHMKDFHPNAHGGVLTSTYGPSAQIVFEDPIAPSLTIYVSAGISYSRDFHRIDARVPIIGEQQTTTSSTTVNTTNPISTVEGVFTVDTFSGINYALGGSFDAQGKEITFGLPVPSHPQTVYVNYGRLPEYTITDAPTGTSGTDITRIDLVYLEYEKIQTEPFSIDFITANRRIVQEVKYTRQVDGFNIRVLRGTQVDPGDTALHPPIPDSDIVPLAYVHMRNNTTAIYNIDKGVIGTGWIEDIRNTI